MPFQRKYESYEDFVISSISHLLGNRYALPLSEIKTNLKLEDLNDVFTQIYLFTLKSRESGWVDKTYLAFSKALHHLLNDHDVRVISPSEPYHKIYNLENDPWYREARIKKMYSTDILIIKDLTFGFNVYKFVSKIEDPVKDEEQTKNLKDFLMDVLEFRLSEACKGKMTFIGYEESFEDIKEIYGQRMIDILFSNKSKEIILD
jgi:hypothetical protein